MAFVNEKLTDEQREEFKKREIKKATSNYIANPIYVTVDRDADYFLWHLDDLGPDDFNHHKFLFDWKGNQYMIILKYSDPDPNSERILWSISDYEKNFIENEPYAADLKEAIRVYAVNGRPNQKGDTKVEITFGGVYGICE